MAHYNEKTIKIIDRGPAGYGFFLAYIGAAIYFIQISSGTFFGVILGLLQAAVWPVYVIYHVLHLLGA
ncbi:MAG TPA: hypothetical protein VIM37_00530 [Candidatus Microsaccharimonas sp.]|jgi:hypothetical protein